MDPTPAWERARKRSVEYSRRDPTSTALYRVIYHYRQQFEWSWEERFQHHYGALRDEVTEAFDEFLNCGILLHGCARAVCERCNQSELIAFSCKERCICPSCDAKRSLLFGEHLHENVLLPFPHVHQVFTLPKMLRVRFKFNRRLLSRLFAAAWESWRELVEDALPGCRPASVMGLHTAGDLLHWHPHVHALTLRGGVDPNGTFHPLDSVNTDYLTACFARNLCDSLLAAEEIDQSTVALIQGWQHSGFSVFVGEPIAADDADARKFLARYIKKSAVSLARLEILEQQDAPLVRVHKRSDDSDTHHDLDPLEFMAELSMHVPNHREQTIRYFGRYSCRTRGAIRLALDTPGPLPVTEPPRRPSPSWARCLAQVFELDPLLCPRCQGRMHIKAFIQNSTEISRIAEHLGLVPWRAPPPFASNPLHVAA